MTHPHANDPDRREAPRAQDDAPWSGPTQNPEDRGTLYAEKLPSGSIALWYDSDRREHAVTLIVDGLSAQALENTDRFYHYFRYWTVKPLKEPV